MIASTQVEIPFFYRGFGRQRGCGFGELAGVIGTGFPFLRICIVPAATRVGADLLEFAVPENAVAFSGRGIFKIVWKDKI